MTITFISNYYNHHQHFLSRELLKRSENFHFIETSQMSEERRKLGYNINSEKYVVSCDESENTKNEILSKSDVIIAGNAPPKMINRVASEKVIFHYSERPFKIKKGWLHSAIRSLKWKIEKRDGAKRYLLCAGAFTSYDYKKCRMYIDRAYKWGYFPETRRYENIDSLIGEKNHNSLLWAGRFLDWKHPNDALQVAKRLKAEGYAFTMNIIGTGELEQKLKVMIEQYQLDDCVHMLGSMPPESVREYMESSQIFLFTSDRNEGWGAVLNESMNSGCAVVASDAIGSVPYLMQDSENGLIYKSGDVNMLFEKVKWLLDNQSFAKKYGKKAYETIVTEWNAEVAAERFLNLASHILAGEKHPDLYKTGPCSKAEILKDDWFTI